MLPTARRALVAHEVVGERVEHHPIKAWWDRRTLGDLALTQLQEALGFLPVLRARRDPHATARGVVVVGPVERTACSLVDPAHHLPPFRLAPLEWRAAFRADAFLRPITRC